MKTERKQLLYRAHYRGFKEAELILSGFVRCYIDQFSDSEIGHLSELLDWPDPMLYDWITGKKNLGTAPYSSLLKRIQAYALDKERL